MWNTEQIKIQYYPIIFKIEFNFHAKKCTIICKKIFKNTKNQCRGVKICWKKSI